MLPQLQLAFTDPVSIGLDSSEYLAKTETIAVEQVRDGDTLSGSFKYHNSAVTAVDAIVNDPENAQYTVAFWTQLPLPPTFTRMRAAAGGNQGGIFAGVYEKGGKQLFGMIETGAAATCRPCNMGKGMLAAEICLKELGICSLPVEPVSQQLLCAGACKAKVVWRTGMGDQWDLSKLSGWHHLAVSAIGGQATFYVDAEPIGTLEFAMSEDLQMIGNVFMMDGPPGKYNEHGIWDPSAINAAWVHYYALMDAQL